MPKLNQQGQAVVEYALLLIVAVALAIALSRSFFQPVRKWTDFYLNTYIACLLDYGVLPESASTTASDCQRKAIEAGIATQNNNQNVYKQNSSGDSVKKRATLAEAIRARQATQRRNESPSPQNLWTVSRKERLDLGPHKEAGEFSASSDFRSISIKSRFVTERTKRFEFAPPPPKNTASVEREENGFNFWSVFRISVIIAIIIAMIFVVGLQLSKISQNENE